MSDQYIVSYDPGLSTGISVVHIPAEGPAGVVDGFQFTGGAVALKAWLKAFDYGTWFPELGFVGGRGYRAIAERFQPINHANYALTTASVTPLVCEGVLLAFDVMPDYDEEPERWRSPAIQYFAGGKDLADKKKRLRAFLKDTDNYRLPKQLGAPDNNDFISATGHAFAYAMKTLKHKPTFELVAEWAGKMDSTNERTGQ